MDDAARARALLRRLAQRVDRITPASLAQRHEPDVEVARGIAGPQVRDAPELAPRLVEHPRLVEREAEVAVLLDARVADLRLRLRRARAAEAVREPGGDEAV